MQKSGYQRAKERQIALMKRGFDMGSKGKITITREELHERRYIGSPQQPQVLVLGFHDHCSSH